MIPKPARVGFILGMVPPADLDRLSHAELISLVIRQFEKIAELERTVATLRDETARLKGRARPAEYQTERYGECDRAAEAGRSADRQGGRARLALQRLHKFDGPLTY